MKIPYYFAIFQKVNPRGGTTTLQVIDNDSHPFMWIRYYKSRYGDNYICTFWKEISQEEYEYFESTVNNTYQ